MCLENNKLEKDQIPLLYEGFNAPITEFDCGERCSPYNENGVPFCCDTNHAVPTALQTEWQFLQENTGLWRLWESEDPEETKQLQEDTPDNQVLIACQGHRKCQRGFRSITCRAFPFFPYITSQGEFIGISYYWEYEDRCWVINNLRVVSKKYREEFIATYTIIFESSEKELENFKHHSEHMREIFKKGKRSIPLLHRDGELYKISPLYEKMRRAAFASLPKFGPYKIAAGLPFPEELLVEQSIG
jgi:hypothetical protein